MSEENSFQLCVVDFSVIANISHSDSISSFIDELLDKGIKIAVTCDFYENYDVITKCANEEQKCIAKLAVDTLDKIKKTGKLIYFSQQTSPEDVVSALCTNNAVLFVYYIYSEFAESVSAHADDLKAFSAIVDETGEFITNSQSGRMVLTRPQVIYEENQRFAVINSNDRQYYLNGSVDKSVADSGFFKIEELPSEGSKVKTRDGVYFELVELIGRGGEGSIFSCRTESDEYTDYVIKIYHRGQLNKLRLQKLRLMEQKQVRYSGICWPEKIVYSMKGEPVGFIMKQIKGKSLSSVFTSDVDILKEFPQWTREDLVKVAIDVLQKIQYLHLLGILIGDLRMKNIVLKEDGTTCLVDIDSAQIGNFPCPTGFPDYTAPEIQNSEFKKFLRTYRNESFSCSVLIFRILFCGIHPYDQKFGADSIEEDIQSRSFPYPVEIAGNYDKVPWGGYTDMWKHIPYQLKEFFNDIFKEDKRYSIQEMILVLKVYGECLRIKKQELLSINRIEFNEE